MVDETLPLLQLWSVDLDRAGASLDALNGALGLLPPQAGGASPSSSPIDQTRQLARIALRVLIAGYVGLDGARLPLVLDPGGKPHLDPRLARAGHGPLNFSLAHAGRVALVGFSALGPLGVDIEAPREVRLSDHRRAMLERAAASLVPAAPLPDAPTADRFIRAWVRLEALAKASGEGIGALLGRLRESGDGHAPLMPLQPGIPAFQVRDLSVEGHDGYRAAVAALPAAIAALHGPAVPRQLAGDTNSLRRWIDAGPRLGTL